MPAAKYTTGALIARFLLKKVAVYALILLAIAVFVKNPITYGLPWLITMFLIWCIVDTADLYGDIWAYNDLRDALANGRDIDQLPETWLERDSNLQKFDGAMLAIFGAGIILLGYSKWLGALGIVFGLAKLIPFMSDADPRDIEKMIIVRST